MATSKSFFAEGRTVGEVSTLFTGGTLFGGRGLPEGVLIDPDLNGARTGALIDVLPTIEPREVPRVVRQSVPPKTIVPRGTAIDLTLVPAGLVTFDLFQQTHTALRGRAITDATKGGGILDDPDIRRTLLQYDTPEKVPAGEKTKLIEALKTRAGVEVNDANVDTSFAAAFNAIRGALAFR